MLVTDFLLNEEQKTYGSVYITSFSTLFQALVCPTLIVIVSWSISYLAVALAERQDTLRLLRDKNAQLLAQEKELREAKLAAEQALSSKTEFFARVSHEFRTPLNVVLGFSEELIKPPPPGEGGQWVALTAETADRVQYILAAGESLLRVVDDILELFRLSSTHSQNGGQLLRVNMTAVDIPSFFGTVCDLVEVISKENGLHFIKHLDPALPRCLIIDRGRFSQLVMNLAFNACKYSRPAGGVVSIRLTNEGPVEDGRPGFITLRLDVQDNGPGIPPEVKDRIFESFFRGGPSMETMEVEEEEAAMPAAAGVPDCYSLPATGGGGGMRGGEMTGYFEDASQLPPGGQRHRGVGAASPYSSPGLPTTNSVSGVHAGFNAGLASGAGVRSQQYLAGASPPPLHASSAGTKAGSHPFPPVLPPPHRNYKAKGHGLGLAITKQLVDLLHGKITVRSSLGLGSLFSILLPAEVAEGSSYEESLAGPGGAGGGGRADGPPPVRDLKILSVEDILVNQIVLGGMLQQDGHRVVFVETGTAALSSIDPSFDLILLDLQLPDMHGIDVLKTLRKDADPLLAAMPIVVVSALVLDREKQECAQAGADGFITKPVKLGLLRQEIRSLWDSGRLRRREERGETGEEEHAAEERPAGERSGKEGGNSGIED
ncbi:hypothetical protein NSK_000931 [Nannochloropsis salina CCMP1776]|uniref:histidine kinase n=1 Tax=Nannochloropsis salina CCMP1776 TaxID=1027361 RepID=A0A4D9D838_9STRA|nr:hypothetical protein NSK_000931 [Nannochloropsis salina CCMP1776]|eukprot:TFJ87580.1 hypothetical protein NSK_000931 [Nannochloropsis salina CCMP1776]